MWSVACAVCVCADDQCTVRVTNLSEETQETDLKELFSYFGSIRRTFLAKDKITQQSKVHTHPHHNFVTCCSVSCDCCVLLWHLLLLLLL